MARPFRMIVKCWVVSPASPVLWLVLRYSYAPSSYRKCSSMKFIIPLSLTLWLFGIALILPAAMGYTGRFYRSASGLCATSFVRQEFGMVVNALGTYAPLAIILGSCAVMIGYFVCGQRRIRPEESVIAANASGLRTAARRTRRMDRRIVYTKMLLLSSLYCAACQMPQTLVVVFYPRVYELYWSVQILRFCHILNPTINTVRSWYVGSWSWFKFCSL